MTLSLLLWLPGLVLTLSAAAVRAQPADIPIADFEGENYGAWQAIGKAFGTGPARGTLPNQMPVSGFQGKGLVNSYLGGDGPTGTLTSPEFKLERKFVAFLIGGGGYAGKTCMNLLVEGKAVRTATGPNTQPGGSEELEPQAWEVGDLAGKMAKIEIVDDATGGWGHINVDQIVLTDTRPAGPAATSREIELTERYLLFPVQSEGAGGRKTRVTVAVEGKTVREFEIEFGEKPEWFAQLDVTAWKGKTATIRTGRLPAGSKSLDLVAASPTLWSEKQIYREPLRPQLHFSPRRGWTNDPNGMVFSQGEYHLYFQHNPYGWGWGNMHWGHAVSKDLVHWQELPIALSPPRYDDMAFSGSAVVDKENTSGWKKGENDLLVAAFTSTARGECIVYSNDRGRTWTEYEKNPVVKHAGRDPRLLWRAASKQWVMALYDEFEGKQWITFHTSPDLKTWTYQSRIEGFFECPDIFELPVGNTKERKWVLTAADSRYVVGKFDGKTFTPETPKLRGHAGAGFYAAQTFTNDPQGRAIQIGWLQAPSPKMPFNQAMSLPLVLGLVKTPDGPRMTWAPAGALKALRGDGDLLSSFALRAGEKHSSGKGGELVEIEVDFGAGEGAVVELVVRGVPILYDTQKQELSVKGHKAVAPLIGGKQRLRVFADRTCLEVFASEGQTYVPLPVIAGPENEVTLAGPGRARLP